MWWGQAAQLLSAWLLLAPLLVLAVLLERREAEAHLTAPPAMPRAARAPLRTHSRMHSLAAPSQAAC